MLSVACCAIMASTLSMPPALPRGRAQLPLYSYMGRLWRIHHNNGHAVVEPFDPELPQDRVLVRLSRNSQIARRVIQDALCVQEPAWANGAMLAAPGSRRELPHVRLSPHHVWIFWQEIPSLESALQCIPYSQRPKLIHATRQYRIRPKVTDQSASYEGVREAQ